MGDKSHEKRDLRSYSVASPCILGRIYSCSDCPHLLANFILWSQQGHVETQLLHKYI